eukprot:IDg8836t1
MVHGGCDRSRVGKIRGPPRGGWSRLPGSAAHAHTHTIMPCRSPEKRGSFICDSEPNGDGLWCYVFLCKHDNTGGNAVLSGPPWQDAAFFHRCDLLHRHLDKADELRVDTRAFLEEFQAHRLLLLAAKQVRKRYARGLELAVRVRVALGPVHGRPPRLFQRAIQHVERLIARLGRLVKLDIDGDGAVRARLARKVRAEDDPDGAHRVAERDGLLHRALSVHLDEQLLVHVDVRLRGDDEFLDKARKVAVGQLLRGAQLLPGRVARVAQVEHAERVRVGEHVDLGQELALDGQLHGLRVQAVDVVARGARRRVVAAEKLDHELHGARRLFLEHRADLRRALLGEVLHLVDGAR